MKRFDMMNGYEWKHRLAACLGVLALLLLSSVHRCAAQEEWELRFPLPHGNHLYGVAVASPEGGGSVSVIGRNGAIFHSMDGGLHWTARESGTTSLLSAITFADSMNGTIVGLGGTVLRTTDGGAVWTPQESGTERWLHAVSFADVLLGIAVGDSGTAISTTDGGASWRPGESGTGHRLRSVCLHDPGITIAVGDSGIVIRSLDGGGSWSRQSSGTAGGLNGITCTRGNVAPHDAWVAVGDSGVILRSTDAGAHWERRPSGTTDRLLGLSFTRRGRSDTGIAVGANGTILRSTDRGLTWTRQASGTTNWIRAVALLESAVGFAVGDFGTILRNSPHDVTGIAFSPPVLEAPYLGQNYPNPFSGTTRIPVTIPMASTSTRTSTSTERITLRVHDVLGQRIATLLDGDLPSGKYIYPFDATGLTPGIYFAVLRLGGAVEMKSMLVLGSGSRSDR